MHEAASPSRLRPSAPSSLSASLPPATGSPGAKAVNESFTGTDATGGHPKMSLPIFSNCTFSTPWNYFPQPPLRFQAKKKKIE